MSALVAGFVAGLDTRRLQRCAEGAGLGAVAGRRGIMEPRVAAYLVPDVQSFLGVVADTPLPELQVGGSVWGRVCIWGRMWGMRCCRAVMCSLACVWCWRKCMGAAACWQMPQPRRTLLGTLTTGSVHHGRAGARGDGGGAAHADGAQETAGAL